MIHYPSFIIHNLIFLVYYPLSLNFIQYPLTILQYPSAMLVVMKKLPEFKTSTFIQILFCAINLFKCNCFHLRDLSPIQNLDIDKQFPPTFCKDNYLAINQVIQTPFTTMLIS